MKKILTVLLLFTFAFAFGQNMKRSSLVDGTETILRFHTKAGLDSYTPNTGRKRYKVAWVKDSLFAYKNGGWQKAYFQKDTIEQDLVVKGSVFGESFEYTKEVGHVNLGWKAGNNGPDEIAIGWKALTKNVGAGNQAVGWGALRENTTGANNNAFGDDAMQTNITGSFNSAFGGGTLRKNTTGNNNTANGTEALYENTTGKYNTANGYKALLYNTTGNNNTAVGFEAGIFGNYTNSVTIGASALSKGNNTVVLGNQTTNTDTYLAGKVHLKLITDETGSTGTVGQVLTRTATGVKWQ